MSRDLIIGNWKMHASHLDAIQMVQKLSYRLESSDYERVEVVVAPPTTALRSVQTVIEADRLSVKLGAQNVHWEEKPFSSQWTFWAPSLTLRRSASITV